MFVWSLACNVISPDAATINSRYTIRGAERRQAGAPQFGASACYVCVLCTSTTSVTAQLVYVWVLC